MKSIKKWTVAALTALLILLAVSPVAGALDLPSCDFLSMEEFYHYVTTPSEQRSDYTVDLEAYIPFDKLYPEKNIDYIVISRRNHYLLSMKDPEAEGLDYLSVRVIYDDKFADKNLAAIYEQTYGKQIRVIESDNLTDIKQFIRSTASGSFIWKTGGRQIELSVYLGKLVSADFLFESFWLSIGSFKNMTEPPDTPEEIVAFIENFEQAIKTQREQERIEQLRATVEPIAVLCVSVALVLVGVIAGARSYFATRRR